MGGPRTLQIPEVGTRSAFQVEVGAVWVGELIVVCGVIIEVTISVITLTTTIIAIIIAITTIIVTITTIIVIITFSGSSGSLCRHVVSIVTI